MDRAVAIDLLLALNAASTLLDLSPFKSLGLHKLKRTRANQWAMTVNGPWRIFFEFQTGVVRRVGSVPIGAATR